MRIPAGQLQLAVGKYLGIAYPGGAPADVSQKTAAIVALPTEAEVPENLLEREVNAPCNLALRLGQPTYPFMKLIIEPSPCGDGTTYFFRVDAHDQHLHAAPGSPDSAWLASVRAANQQLVQQIEAAWAEAGLPTFKEYLRRQLEQRKSQRSEQER